MTAAAGGRPYRETIAASPTRRRLSELDSKKKIAPDAGQGIEGATRKTTASPEGII